MLEIKQMEKGLVMNYGEVVYEKFTLGEKVVMGSGADTPWEQLSNAIDARDEAKIVSDGSTASYYELPKGCKELQDLISAKNMNAQIGEIFRACYRYGQVAHSPEIRDIKKILFYANAELKRLEGK